VSLYSERFRDELGTAERQAQTDRKQKVFRRSREPSRGCEPRAVVRAVAHGRELRVYVGDDLRWSRLFPQHEGSQSLLELSDTTRAAFEARGWVRDMTVKRGDGRRRECRPNKCFVSHNLFQTC